MNAMDKILALVGGFVLCFVITMIVIFCVKGSVPDVLIQYTLGAGGVECLFLAAIKITKIRHPEQSIEDTEEEDGDIV